MIGSTGGRDDRPGDGAERTVLLHTKLHVPAIGERLVCRSALLDDLSAGRHCKLTVVSAPAGWGKTTLLAQWVSDANPNDRFGWLSLDSSDNDPVWFWMYLVAALQQVSPGLGARAVELLTMAADPVQVVLPTLLNDLESTAAPIVLIIDDYNQVVNRAIHAQMAFFVNHLPANVHVVVASRSDPTLPLARLRAGGELSEIRSGDLRFDPVEAGLLLNDVLGLNLSDIEVQLLHQRTEGWAAGLYLAALSLAGRTDSAEFIKTFAGDNRHIVDYLMAEVLDGQPQHIRNFLLRTSVLRRFSGALCDAMLGTTGSAALLEEIEHENLFLVPMDMSRGWYRCHHLFGDLLRAELHRCEPDLVAELHRRAAAWFDGEGLVDEAVRHLVAAGDIARSADLIAADWVNEFNGGGLSTVSGWLDSLPGETVLRDPRLSVIRAWIALHRGQFDDARWWIDAVESESDTVDQGGLSAQLAALRVVHAFKTGDLTTAFDVASRAITLDFDDVPHARPAVWSVYGSALYFADSLEEAAVSFRRAVDLADAVGDRRRRVYALGYLALIAAESGQLADAEYQILRAAGAGEDTISGENFIDAMLSLAAARVFDARGDSYSAAEASRLAVNLARKGAGILEVAKTLLVRAGILERLGDHEAAVTHRDEAVTLLRRCTDAGVAARLAVADPAGRNLVRSGRNPSGPVIEELTAKEHEILRLLATRLSRREIGQRLYVSLNTVKTHQRAVYRKLGVEDRSAAVTRARELGLL